jgi:hypothetical protein
VVLALAYRQFGVSYHKELQEYQVEREEGLLSQDPSLNKTAQLMMNLESPLDRERRKSITKGLFVEGVCIKEAKEGVEADPEVEVVVNEIE